MKKALILLTCLLILFSTMTMVANAVNYPVKPITIVVGFGAGGNTDTGVRSIQPYLEQQLGVRVLVENRAGAGAAIARNYVYQQPADGYTIFGGLSSDLIFSTLHADVQVYEDFLEAFVPLASWINDNGNAIVISVDSEIETFEEFIEASKVREMDVAIAGGYGSSGHAAALIIQETFGVNWNLVPYGSGSEVALAIRTGEVDMTVVGVLTEAISPRTHKILATTTRERLERAPDVMTFTEMGYPNLEIPTRVGAYIKRGTPEEIISILEEAIKESFYHPGFQDWAKRTQQPLGEFSDREDWTNFLTSYNAQVQAIMPLILDSIDR